MRLLRPFLGQVYVIGHLFGREAQRVVLVKDDHSVPGVILGHVGGGDGMLPPQPAKSVGRRPCQWLAETAARLGLEPDHLFQIGLVALPGVRGPLCRGRGLDRPPGPQRVEQRPLQGHPVRQPDDLLPAHGIDGAKLLREPGLHRLGRHSPTLVTAR